ncbi:MAG TPA: hypothetical protein DHH42_01045 [Clostridiales bacterium]|nr:hypothetical protein [Clostridiales bacterium]
MSKKGLKTMLVCIVLLIGLVTLFACNKSDVADKDGQTKVIVKIQDEDGSIYKENVVFSDLFTLSLQKEGYTGRLYRDADFLKPLTKDSKVKNGDTVYVKWTINSYTVTFMDGKNVLKTEKVQHGSAATAPEVPEQDGKTFKEWDKGFSNVTSDLTINAVYDVDTFTVTFKDGEKVLETQTVEYEASATAPDIARLSPPEGMHFAKWDKDFSKVTENIEVSAVYELNVYTVIFKNGETVISIQPVKHGFAATAPNVYDTATKKFVGWDKSFDNVTSDLIVNAKFETKKFALTFINYDGTTVHTAEVEYGASIDSHFETADSAATYDTKILDYDGWYKADGTRIDELDLPTMPAENFTLTLKLSLMDSAIGDFKVNTPADFTFTESNTAEFSVMPNEGTTLHAGVTYKYIWTINKDNVFYKTEETTESSLTLQNLAAGEYLANVKIVASMENCGSVENDFMADKTLIVSRADISGITVTGVTMTYGDKTAKIGISGLLADDVVTYGTDGTTFPLQNVDLSALDCGEHDYYVRVYRGDNYNPYTSGKITVTINKATVSATITPKSDKLTYGDNLPSLTAKIGEETYTIESGKYELHFVYTKITGNVANNVGTYNIENVDISVLRENYPEKNYDIKLTTVGTITINEAKLTVTVSLDKTELTYGEALPIITYKFDGLKLSDTEENFTITKTEFAEKLDVGTYTAEVTLSGEKTNFYNITVNTVEFKVNKRPATITIDKVNDITYGDKAPDLSAKVDGELAGDKLSYKLKPNYTVGAGKGEYTASVEFNPEAAENKNYAITATGTTFNVGKKKLTIKLNNTATVAVGKTYTVNAEHLEKIGLVAGDTVTEYVTITKDVAGTYYADDFDKSNLVITNADCYVISYEMSVTFVEVGKFAIDFADVTLTYDGQPHSVKVTKTDATKNYTITYGESAENCNLEESPKYTNAGAYPIYFKVVDNETQAEHVGSVTLTINKKAVTVKVKDVTITYGGTPKFEYTVSGLIDPDKLSGKAVYSGAGTDAGVYDISVSGLSASKNYNVTPVPGKLTINKKSATVTWTNEENRDYSPDGQTLPTATYDGKTASLIFTKDGKACEFKNAGTYTVTVADDNNYTLSGETTKTITINKAKYMFVTAHTALSGTYDPNKTLGNYALSEGFTWVNPDEVPVCTKKKYDAKYNMDPANYEDFVTTVTLDLQKATVTLAQNLFEFNYDDGVSHKISTEVMYGTIKLDKSLYHLEFEKDMFSAAGTHKTTATLTADNFALSDNVVYVKVRGVKVGNNYYTIEDALFNSKSGDTVEFISAAKEVSFAPLDIATAIYADNAYRTVKAGVTLKLASDEDSSAKIGKPTYGNGVGNYVDTDSSKIKYKLILNESTVLEVYGNILIQGLLGVNGPGLSGHTSGNHSQIINNGTINLNSGANLDLRGYIKGAGTIEARSGAIVYSPFVVYDYRGGTNTKTVYEKAKIAPFRIYEMPNIQCNYSILYGAEHKGYLDLYASDKHRSAVATIFGNGSAMMIMEDSTAHITTTYERTGNLIGETTLTMTGKVKMGVLKIKVTTTVTVAMNEVRFPMPWNFTINVGDGLNPTTFTLPDDYKMMTGATVNVKKNATVNLTGTLLIYKSFTDTPFGGTVYPNKGAAKLNVEGVVNAIGGIAGEVHGINGGKVIIGNNAILSITEKEGNSGNTTSFQALLDRGEFVTIATISEVAKVVNADNSTVAAEIDRTYNYSNGMWQ